MRSGRWALASGALSQSLRKKGRVRSISVKRFCPSLVTVLVLVFAYSGLFWSLLGCESAGMQFMKLRLLTFDGQTPGAVRGPVSADLALDRRGRDRG